MAIIKAFLHNIAEGVEPTDGINLSQLISGTQFWQDPVSDQVDFTTAEPVAPSLGDRYINTVTGVSNITATPVTAGNIYEWDGAAWVETTVLNGMSTYDDTLDAICSYNGSAWVCAVTAQYVTDYFVSADIGDDSNTGLFETTAFATLGAALDAIETAAVPAAIHILDDNTYTVTESSGTPGIRNVGVAITVQFPYATIVGQGGGVVWRTNGDVYFGKEMNGALLTMEAQGLGALVLTHYHLQALYEPNDFWTQQSGAGTSSGQIQVFVDNITDATNTHEGGIADFTNANRQGVFRLTSQNVTLVLNKATRTYDFRIAGGDSAMSIQIFNNDSKNNGAGDHVLVNAITSGRIYYRAECVGSTPAAAAECDATSSIYINASDASDGGPLPYLGTVANIHDWSWQEGQNFAKLPANTGLTLSDIINIHDVTANAQVQATLQVLQDTIGGAETLAETLALGNTSGANNLLMDDTQIIQLGSVGNDISGNGDDVTLDAIGDIILLFSNGSITVNEFASQIFLKPNLSGTTYQTTLANTRTTWNVQGNGAMNARIQTTYGNDGNAYSRLEQAATNMQMLFGPSITSFIINGDRSDVDTIIRGDTDLDLIYANAGTDQVGIGTSTPSEKLEVDGNVKATDVIGISKLSYTVVSKVFGDSPYTTADGEVILYDATGGNVTVDLPTAAAGAQINIKKTDASANTVTVDGFGGQTIDGGATAILTTQYENITIVSDGSNWFII